MALVAGAGRRCTYTVCTYLRVCGFCHLFGVLVGACVALVAGAGRRCTYTVCYLLCPTGTK